MPIDDHHDGHRLNEKLLIVHDEARYHYTIGDASIENDEPFASITFQSQNPADGVNGVTDEAVAAILLDRHRAWQKDRLGTKEGARIIELLEELLRLKKQRADDRAERGVLGSQKV